MIFKKILKEIPFHKKNNLSLLFKKRRKPREGEDLTTIIGPMNKIKDILILFILMLIGLSSNIKRGPNLE